jgi:hypothetical protein
MATQTVQQMRAVHRTSTAAAVAYAGAAAFVIAAAWFWLATKGVTVAAAPQSRRGETAVQALRSYYHWQATTLAQERWYTVIAIAGFLCLATVAFAVRDALGHGRALARAGALAIGAGALTWIAGSLVQVGGHRAVGLMAGHSNPITAVNSIAFTIDLIVATFAVAAFALAGAGLLAFAVTAQRTAGHRAGTAAWAGYTIVVALLLLITAGAYAADNSDLANLLLFADGVAGLPVWLIWTGRSWRAAPAVG